MSHEEQMDRLISLRARVNLNEILNGTTTRNEDKRIAEAYSRMQDMRPFMFCTDTESALTVAGINALIQERDPDVVFIDGIYFMQSALPNVEPGSPQALTDISRITQTPGPVHTEVHRCDITGHADPHQGWSPHPGLRHVHPGVRTGRQHRPRYRSHDRTRMRTRTMRRGRLWSCHRHGST